MSALVAEGADVDPWRFVPDGGDASVLHVPGLFSEVAACAGYAATRSEDLVDQFRIMIDAIGAEGASRITQRRWSARVQRGRHFSTISRRSG
ncbi:MAG: hypothetical protein EOP66_03505 [Sphingomonas sp.]|nr:MAG: hypothetical protein EOP66_03505 [Sphingomonas sp.]